MTDGRAILVGSALLAAALLASLLAGRVRIPGLVLFLAVGMLVGSDGLGLIDFDDYEAARTVGIVALALILFEGGLTSGLLEVRPVLGTALSLAVLGTTITAAVTGLAASFLFDLSTLQGLLVGAILASTDGAAIFGLLRGSTLRRRLARTLEAESGLNDPIAVLFVLGLIEAITRPDYGAADFALLFVEEVFIGLLVGLFVGWAAVEGFRRARLESAGLYPVASLAAAGLAYGGADVLHGSGFLAVYLTGLALGTANIPAKQTITVFHQGLGWVAQLVMFLTLGLLVFPGQLLDVALEGALLAVVVVFVARPLAVLAATALGRYAFAEQVLLSWAGLRGAVPVVLATFPVIESVPGSLELFNLVFFAVVLSTLLQGSTFEGLARRLGLTTTQPALPRPLAEAGTIRALGAEVLEFPVGETDAVVDARVRDLGLPRDAVVNVIVRGQEAIPPRGSTRLRAGDELHVLVRQESARAVYALSERWRTGPVGRPARVRVRPHGGSPIFSAWGWTAADGDPSRPERIRDVAVVDQLRIRRDAPGGLFALADGRYAITGAVAAVGGREDLFQWARRRIAQAGPDERAWLQNALGALARDPTE